MSSYSVLAFSARDLPKDYVPMIYSRWLRSFRAGNDYFKLINPSKNYYDRYHAYVTNILARPEAVVRLAVLSDDKDVALGFAVSRGTVLDYIFVDKDQRRQGIATALLPKHIDTITCLTRTAMSIWGTKYRNWAFDPFV